MGHAAIKLKKIIIKCFFMQDVSQQFVWCVHLSFVNFALHQTPTKQSHLVRQPFLIRHMSMNLTLEGPCIIFCNIYTFQRDTQCCSTDCLLMHRCQLYMFRTVTVHPQELLFRCCMCRLWYVVRTALSDTSRWYNF